MIRVTVNRDGIDKGVANPIQLEGSGWSAACTELKLMGDVRIVYRPDAPLADGTRVWIEAERVEVLHVA